MAADQITNRQYMELASAISVRTMRKIALGYLDLSHSTIKNIEADHQGDVEAQSREILRKWAYKNPDDQVKVGSESNNPPKYLIIERQM